jgi:hypothetical protein
MAQEQTKMGWMGKAGALLAAAAGMGVLASPAQAQTDRINDQPTGWWYYFNRTTANIDADLALNRRPFNLGYTGTNYDVIEVANTGEYAASGMDVLWAQTTGSISSAMALQGKRIIDLEAANATGTLFTATVVNNSGATAAVGWSWATNLTYTQLGDWQDTTGLRPIDVDTYSTPAGTRYSVVGVPNTGANAQGWWWYFGVSEAQINSFLSTNGARLIDIDVVDNNPMRFNVVMVSQNTGADWWYYNKTSSEVGDILDQTAGRLTCLHRYTDSGGATKFAIALVDNANTKTRRVRAYMDNALDSGVYGFKIQEVGGSVLGALNENFAFEPASMIKILHATYAMDQIAAGNDTLTENLLIRDRCNNDECPDPATSCNSGNEQLQQAIREMLEQSDNNRTMEIELKYGRTNLNNYAAALGLTNTQINHRLGCLCGNPFNSFSATDACNLYEAIADGSLFSQSWQNTLYTLMLDKESQGWGVCATLSNIIDAEAASTNLTGSELIDFRDQVNFAAKGGGYGCSGTAYRTQGGWAKIPFKEDIGGIFGWTVVPREYTVASFVHAGTDANGATIAYPTAEELLREEVRAALQSWDSACSTPNITGQPVSRLNVAPESTQTFSVSLAIGAGTRTYQWQKLNTATNSYANMSNVSGQISGVTTNTLTFQNVAQNDEGRFRCVVSSICGSDTSSSAQLTVGNVCDGLDFNRDGITPDSSDLDDFIAVLSGGPLACSTFPVPGCNDLDFNNDGIFPDATDLDAFLSRLAGGPCVF